MANKEILDNVGDSSALPISASFEGAGFSIPYDCLLKKLIMVPTNDVALDAVDYSAYDFKNKGPDNSQNVEIARYTNQTGDADALALNGLQVNEIPVKVERLNKDDLIVSRISGSGTGFHPYGPMLIFGIIEII